MVRPIPVNLPDIGVPTYNEQRAEIERLREWFWLIAAQPDTTWSKVVALEALSGAPMNQRGSEDKSPPEKT